MKLTSDNIKGPYSSTVPKFDFPELTGETIKEHENMVAAMYPVVAGGLPIVIVVRSDRLHVYVEFEGKMQELKYNAFNEDMYARCIGRIEERLRERCPDLALFGYFHPSTVHFPDCQYNCRIPSYIEVFHIWDTIKSVWLDIKQVQSVSERVAKVISDYVTFPKKILHMPINKLPDNFTNLIQENWIFMRGTRNPSLFFMAKNHKIG